MKNSLRHYSWVVFLVSLFTVISLATGCNSSDGGADGGDSGSAGGGDTPSEPKDRVPPAVVEKAQLRFDVDVLEFENTVAVGERSEITITVSNTGDMDATQLRYYETPDYPMTQQSTTCGETLAGDQTCEITMSFVPENAIEYSGNLGIEFFDGNELQKVELRTHAQGKIIAGTLDIGFNQNGKKAAYVYNSVASAMAKQPDGKIVVVSNRLGGIYVSRFLTNSEIDTTFGNDYNDDGTLDGLFFIRLNNAQGSDEATAVTVQPDNKIVVVGNHLENNVRSVFAMRLNSNGSLDESFNTVGYTIAQFQGRESYARAVQYHSWGYLYIGGFSVNNNGTAFSSADDHGDFAWMKIATADGLVVSSRSYEFGEFSQDDLYALEIKSNGRVLLAGRSRADGDNTYFHMAMVMISNNGVVDTTFGTDGYVLQGTWNGREQQINDVLFQADNKIVVAGSESIVGANRQMMLVARFNADGTLDNSFSGRGWQETMFQSSNPNDSAKSVAIDAQGRVIIAGTVNFQCNGVGPVNQELGLARYLADGSLDNVFGNNKNCVDGPAPHAQAGMSASKLSQEAAVGMFLDFQDHIIVGGATDYVENGPAVNSLMLMRFFN